MLWAILIATHLLDSSLVFQQPFLVSHIALHYLLVLPFLIHYLLAHSCHTLSQIILTSFALSISSIRAALSLSTAFESWEKRLAGFIIMDVSLIYMQMYILVESEKILIAVICCKSYIVLVLLCIFVMTFPLYFLFGFIVLIYQMNSDRLPTACHALVKVHKGPIYTIKFNSDGEYCMTGSEDRSVSLYNPAKNLMIKNYKNIHNYDVSSIDISKDNTKFISGGGDKNVILTDVVEGKYIRKYTGHTARINSVCFNPENNVIVSASYDTSVRLWDNRSDSYHPIDIIKGFKDSVSQVKVVGFKIVCSSIDGSIKFFDIRKGEVTTDSLSESVQRFAMANSNKAYAASCTNNKIYLVEKQSGIKIQQYIGHQVSQFTVDLIFNAKDTHLISGSADGSLFIYDLMKKTPSKTLKAHEKALSALDLHESGGLVSGGHDGLVCYWKI